MLVHVLTLVMMVRLMSKYMSYACIYTEIQNVIKIILFDPVITDDKLICFSKKNQQSLNCSKRIEKKELVTVTSNDCFTIHLRVIEK